MARICPQCSQANQEDTTFCRFCGYRFDDIASDATIRPGALASIPANADPASTLKTGDQAAQAQAAPQPTPAPAPAMMTPQPPAGYPPYATPNPAQPQAQAMPQPVSQGGYSMQPYGQAPNAYAAPVMAQAPGAGASVLQRAFAGKGTPIHHQSWLLDSKQVQPAALRDSLIGNLQKQGVMGINAAPERLREHSVVMEERDYVRVQYGTSAVFVYMAPMGQSLYVSRTSTVQQPYSRTRMTVLITLLILMIISWVLSALIDSTIGLGTSGFVFGLNTLFSYAFFGLLFFFIYVLIRSIIFALTDKDFLAYLRTNRLNDFTLDALSSVEKVTDKAVRETLKQAGLNADEITPPAQSYALSQALHRF